MHTIFLYKNCRQMFDTNLNRITAPSQQMRAKQSRSRSNNSRQEGHSPRFTIAEPRRSQKKKIPAMSYIYRNGTARAIARVTNAAARPITRNPEHGYGIERGVRETSPAAAMAASSPEPERPPPPRAAREKGRGTTRQLRMTRAFGRGANKRGRRGSIRQNKMTRPPPS